MSRLVARISSIKQLQTSSSLHACVHQKQVLRNADSESLRAALARPIQLSESARKQIFDVWIVLSVTGVGVFEPNSLEERCKTGIYEHGRSHEEEGHSYEQEGRSYEQDGRSYEQEGRSYEQVGHSYEQEGSS